VRKHSHFQTPLGNPSIQTHLVLLFCIKRLCIFGPKGAIQIRYLLLLLLLLILWRRYFENEKTAFAVHGAS